MRPLQISPETAQKLAKELNVPLEHVMHMPPHILMRKLAELAARQGAEAEGGTGENAGGSAPDGEGSADRPNGGAKGNGDNLRGAGKTVPASETGNTEKTADPGDDGARKPARGMSADDEQSEAESGRPDRRRP